MRNGQTAVRPTTCPRVDSVGVGLRPICPISLCSTREQSFPKPPSPYGVHSRAQRLGVLCYPQPSLGPSQRRRVTPHSKLALSRDRASRGEKVIQPQDTIPRNEPSHEREPSVIRSAAKASSERAPFCSELSILRLAVLQEATRRPSHRCPSSPASVEAVEGRCRQGRSPSGRRSRRSR